MNIDNRATKVYLKSIAPIEAYDQIDRFKIPSPQKECLIAMINGKEGFEGCDYLSERFKINIGYWTFGRRLKDGLEMFRRSKKYIDNMKNIK